MDVVVLQVFVSLMLAVGSILLFVHSAKQRDHDHSQRLALLPLESEEPAPTLGEVSGARSGVAARGGNRVSESQRAFQVRAPGEEE